MAKAREEHSDYDEVISNLPPVVFPPVTLDAVRDSDHSAELLYHFGKHPEEAERISRMNPLQQVTYLALLNVLLPLQIVTGILIWGAERWPAYSAALGGLAVVTPLHNLGSWLFMSFTLGHMYLTTTGHTLTSNLAAMVGGWDEVEADASARKEEDHGVA